MTGVFDGILAEGARRWSGNIQRNRATAGGAVAVAAANDPLLAALLACDAAVVLYGMGGFREEALVDFLPRRAEALAGAGFDHWPAHPFSGPRLGQTAGLRLVSRRTHAGRCPDRPGRSPADGRRTAAAPARGWWLAELGPAPLRLPEIEERMTGQAWTTT